MALQKPLTVLGTTYEQGYIKVSGFTVREVGYDGAGKKLYDVSVTLDLYTDSSKQYQIRQEDATLWNLSIEDLTITTIYTKLLALDEFSSATSV